MKNERRKRINTVAELREAWLDYRSACDGATALRTEFCHKTGEFVTGEIPAPITCTIKGFCRFIGMSEANFYLTYDRRERFSDEIARMKQDCELDARAKFENGTLNPRLAGLWMSNYGYGACVEAHLGGDMALSVNVDYGPLSDTEKE